MPLYSFNLPEQLLNSLKSLSRQTGAPVSELIRRSTKEYLEKRGFVVENDGSNVISYEFRDMTRDGTNG